MNGHDRNGNPGHDLARNARDLLDEEYVERAHLGGRALRLGYTVSGGVPGLLRRTHITLDNGEIILAVPEDEIIFMSDQVRRRFEKLARVVGREAHLETFKAE